MFIVLLRIARSLAVAAHDLDLVGVDSLARILHLEGNILDQESPNLVAEAVCIKVALFILVNPPLNCLPLLSPFVTYLERQSRLHLVCQHLRNAAIKVRQDLHRKLWLDATLADQVVEGVRQSHADAK